jgi:hypothetical protein
VTLARQYPNGILIINAKRVNRATFIID